MARRPKEEIERSLLERRQALAEANEARERALAERQACIARKNQEKVDRIDREIKLRALRTQERNFINWLREAMLSGHVPVDYDRVRDAVTAVLIDPDAAGATGKAAEDEPGHAKPALSNANGVQEVGSLDLTPFQGTIGELFGADADELIEDHRA